MFNVIFIRTMPGRYIIIVLGYVLTNVCGIQKHTCVKVHCCLSGRALYNHRKTIENNFFTNPQKKKILIENHYLTKLGRVKFFCRHYIEISYLWNDDHQ